ncbi:ABC transporter substrate-binding protein [Basfia succiniciproducens]|uniref:ABC transporter substrate-binding protein n=1 Tax=Basfia succiniciproducens TaxID=653940 RepID=UPI0008AAF677|nr:ABC transporter substrate-binding protein [Basfia succiniciproducens]SEQ50219.1 phosphoglycerate transport regulatory protein PgtC [Basfia succiniciproducens]
MWRNLKLILFSLIPLGQVVQASELVIGTTFAQEGIQHLLDEWNKQPNAFSITTLNRTSISLNQLLTTERADNVDIILSSSPMLFYNLQQKNKLDEIPKHIDNHKQFVPPLLQQTTIAFSLSGYGMLLNRHLLQQYQLTLPTSWQDLTAPQLQGLVIISSPTRSDTNHIILEALLQKYGWQDGWALISQIMANVGTISSRSFGVVDKIQANIGAVGITIDNYANILTQQNQDNLEFRYFDHFPISPTFVAIVAESNKKTQALQFIEFLLSPKGQIILTDNTMGKFPIMPLPSNSTYFQRQQQLFAQPQINYTLLIKRQNLVKLLFEQMITYRLNQLQENWRMLHNKEHELQRQLPELRKILTALPVSAEQSLNEAYLQSFNNNQELLNWQNFFIKQQLEFIKGLESQ